MNNDTSQSRANELEDRLINFAVGIVKLSAGLPRTPAGKHVAGQIQRSGSSPAPNYGEARAAESHADFVCKLRIVLKELNETSIWLRTIERKSHAEAPSSLRKSFQNATNSAGSLLHLSKRRVRKMENEKSQMTIGK